LANLLEDDVITVAVSNVLDRPKAGALLGCWVDDEYNNDAALEPAGLDLAAGPGFVPVGILTALVGFE
jgi:hypothetical protein